LEGEVMDEDFEKMNIRGYNGLFAFVLEVQG